MVVDIKAPKGPVPNQDYLILDSDDEGEKSLKLKKRRADQEVVEDTERARAKIINDAPDAIKY